MSGYDENLEAFYGYINAAMVLEHGDCAALSAFTLCQHVLRCSHETEGQLTARARCAGNTVQ